MSTPPLHPLRRKPGPYRPASSNGYAITSMVLGIVSIVLTCGPFTALPGVIVGHIGMNKAKREPESGGFGMALTGLILSYLVMLVTLGLVLVFVLNPQIREGFAEGVRNARESATTFELVPPEAAEVVTLLPEGHDPKTPLPVLIWLHGYGSSPIALEYDGMYQRLANEKEIAVVGISATAILEREDLGNGIELVSYQWTEDVATDAGHLESVLELIRDEVLPEPGRILLFGFSQGGKAAGDIAAAHPERYLGGGVFSPGGMHDPASDTMQADLSGQEYLVVTGDGESPGNLGMARTFRELLQDRSAHVYYRETGGQEDHTMPTDEYDLLSSWIDRALR